MILHFRSVITVCAYHPHTKIGDQYCDIYLVVDLWEVFFVIRWAICNRIVTIQSHMSASSVVLLSMHEPNCCCSCKTESASFTQNFSRIIANDMSFSLYFSMVLLHAAMCWPSVGLGGYKSGACLLQAAAHLGPSVLPAPTAHGTCENSEFHKGAQVILKGTDL